MVHFPCLSTPREPNYMVLKTILLDSTADTFMTGVSIFCKKDTKKSHDGLYPTIAIVCKSTNIIL